MEPIWAATFLAATLPFCIVAGLSDLRSMIIPNWVSLCILSVFCVLCLFAFPIQEIAFRLGIMLVVFTVGFILNSFGFLGGGDAKLLTVMAPFVAGPDAFSFVFGIALWSLLTFALHRAVMHSALKERYFSDWVSFHTKRKFPYGLPIVLGFIGYLWSNAVPLG